MNVTIKAHWCYRGQVLNLAISRCCDPATDLEQIAENAATHALQRLQNRETYPEGLPWSVCHSEGSQFYVIFTPAETAHAGSHTHGETTTNQLFFHIYFLVAEKEEEGGKGGEEIEVLLQKLRCEFTIPDDVITALLPMTTSLSFTERNEITYDNSLAGRYPPGSIFMAVNDNNIATYSSSGSTSPFMRNTYYGAGIMNFQPPQRESLVEPKTPSKAHESMVCMPAKPTLPLFKQDNSAKSDVTRREPVTAEPPPTTENLTSALIRPHQKLQGIAAFTPMGNDSPGFLRKGYAMATPTTPCCHTPYGESPIVSTPRNDATHPLRLEAIGGQQEAERKKSPKEDHTNEEGETMEIFLNQENNEAQVDDDNFQPVCESGSCAGLQSSSPTVSSPPCEQVTQGQSTPYPKGGMVPGIEKTVLPDSPLLPKTHCTQPNTKSPSTALNEGTKTASPNLHCQRATTISRMHSAPLLSIHQDSPSLDDCRTGHSLEVNPVSDTASSYMRPTQVIGQVCDEDPNTSAPKIKCVSPTIKRGEEMGRGEEEEGCREEVLEVVMGGGRGVGGDKLQVPLPPNGRHSRAKQKAQIHPAVCMAPTVPQEVLDSELRLLHALEHACNEADDSCQLKKENNLELCSQLYDAQLVQQLEEHITAHRNGGKLTPHMKKLIETHCDYCRDKQCQVPHLAVGRRPAGENPTPTPSPFSSTSSSLTTTTSTTSTTHSSILPSPALVATSPIAQAAKSCLPYDGIASPSFDMHPANDSRVLPTINHTQNDARLQLPLLPPTMVSVDTYPANDSRVQPASYMYHHAAQNEVAEPLPSVFHHAPISFDQHAANNSRALTGNYHTAQNGTGTPPPHLLHPMPLAQQNQVESPDLPYAYVLHASTHLNPCATAMVAGNSYPPRLSNLFCRNSVRVFEDKPYWPGRMNFQQEAIGSKMQRSCSEQYVSSFEGFTAANGFSPGTIVYSSSEMKSQLIQGAKINLPDLKKAKVLGKGGNGTTYKYIMANREVAIKCTLYRVKELNEWYKFDHPNVTKLLAVLMEHDSHCLQFMDMMGESLSVLLRRQSKPLCDLCDPPMFSQWNKCIMPNTRHIVRGMLQGLDYLHRQNCVQHCDVKASNVLTRKFCGCSDIFHCECPAKEKCMIQLADFDSVKTAKKSTFCADGPLPFVPLSPEECRKVMGTPGYRAPEQFVKDPAVLGSQSQWCIEEVKSDVWSFGVTVLNLFLGPNKPHDKQNAWILALQPNHSEFSRTEVQSEAIHAILKVLNLSTMEPRRAYDLVSLFIKHCLEPDFRRRPTAQQLLFHEFLREK